MRLQPKVVCEDRVHEFMNPSCPIVQVTGWGSTCGYGAAGRKATCRIRSCRNSFMTQLMTLHPLHSSCGGHHTSHLLLPLARRAFVSYYSALHSDANIRRVAKMAGIEQVMWLVLGAPIACATSCASAQIVAALPAHVPGELVRFLNEVRRWLCFCVRLMHMCV